MLDQVEAFFALLERFKRYWRKKAQPPEPETLAGRFLRLFAAHGVHANQIPRFFGHGLALRDVQSAQALARCLTDEHLAAACELFGVRRSWLERGEGQAHEVHHFYLQPEGFGTFLDALPALRQQQGEHMWAKLFMAGRGARNEESVLLLEEPVGELNEDVIYRRHYIDAGPLSYWKARVSTTALLAQLLRRKVWVQGRECEPGWVAKLFQTKDLLTVQDLDDLYTRSHRVEVDDWLLEPDALLEGIDPERNQFGAQSALQLWLDLDARGLMRMEFTRPDTRQRFEERLQRVFSTAAS